MSEQWGAGRGYARIYPVRNRVDVHAFLLEAVARSGGRVLYASDASRAPVFLGVLAPGGERLGLLVYPFRMTRVRTRNRPTDEVRGQIRYGGEKSWETDDHHVGRDLAGVDTTIMLAVYLEQEVLVGLDPALYDPLPMGISVYAKDAQVAAAQEQTWHVWERDNREGPRRARRRKRPESSPAGRQDSLETLVAFTPDRLLDYARFERRASDLRLDEPLRFTAAQDAAAPRRRLSSSVASAAGDAGAAAGTHQLERDFALSSSEILEIISTRTRLAVAVRGGVAEYHLERVLLADPQVAHIARLDQDAQHDFDVTLTDGRLVRVECKNVSPERYTNGDYKVEVQKTRASKGDPASRFYRVDQFDVVAACLYAPTRDWAFRYALTTALARHSTYPDRLAPLQHVDATWAAHLADAAAPTAGP